MPENRKLSKPPSLISTCDLGSKKTEKNKRFKILPNSSSWERSCPPELPSFSTFTSASSHKNISKI